LQVVKAFGRAIALSLTPVLASALIMASAPAAAQFSDGYNFLKAVKDRDATKVTELLAEPGTVVVNTKDRGSGEAALHMVVRGRDYDWLSFLLAKRANPNVQNMRGETPLSLAAQIGWTDGARLLLAQGAAVDLGNQRGETPLITAVQRRDPAMVALLMGAGANPAKKDNAAGYSALDYAHQDGRSAGIVKLLEAGQRPVRGAAGPKL
jgi:ankyrin repeat protein